MDSFDDRKKGFEKKFVHDEELQFKINARKNKYLGEWISQILGYDQEKEKLYIQSIIKADFEEAGDEDVFRKIKIDLKNQNISDENIRKKIIINGCSILRSTNKPAVAIIIHPIISDFVAAEPTNPNIISKLDKGAESIS